MRKHAEGIGGTLTLTSAIGKGTAVSVRIPL
jgi:signal transduction histidine kinase